MLAPVSSYALELGEARIISGLGQSLLVEIPYRLASGERLTPACIDLAPALRPASALPTYTRASRVTITPTHIEIFGASRVVEPLIGLNVDVRCASAPRFVRSFELFVDPPIRVPGAPSNGVRFAIAPGAAASDTTIPVVAASQPRAATSPTTTSRNASVNTETTVTPRANASARARGQTGETLAQGQTYVVVRGDTLSGIAARIGERPTIRETAEAIFAANPQAFTRGNRDLIEAGRSLTIPLLTAAAVAAPATAAATPVPAVREAELPVALPSAELAPAPAIEAPAQPATTTSAVVPAAVAPPATPVAAVEPSAAPARAPIVTATATASPASASARSSIWLTALLALGAAILLSAPILFIRRRKPHPAAPSVAKARAVRPRQFVDPIAGFDVVEGESPRTPTVNIENVASPKRAATSAVAARATAPAESAAHALNIGPTDSVDLDVGTPIVDPRVDWFGDRADAATVAIPAAAATMENAATAKMLPDLDRTDTVRQPPLEPAADITDSTLDDQGHTLTVVELDILRQDYEAQHTLTQHGNKELREALADLRATQAGHAAAGDTATLEMPQQAPVEALESQRTQKLRSSR